MSRPRLPRSRSHPTNAAANASDARGRLARAIPRREIRTGRKATSTRVFEDSSSEKSEVRQELKDEGNAIFQKIKLRLCFFRNV